MLATNHSSGLFISSAVSVRMNSPRIEPRTFLLAHVFWCSYVVCILGKKKKRLTHFMEEPQVICIISTFSPGKRDKPRITKDAIQSRTWTQKAEPLSLKSHSDAWKNLVFAYLKGEYVVTWAFLSNRKCFWLILPVLVSMVTTGKPICRIQRFMISSSEAGRDMWFCSTAW